MSEKPDRPYFLNSSATKFGYPILVFLPGMDESVVLARLQTAGLEVGFDVRYLIIPPAFLCDWDELTKIAIDLIQSQLKPLVSSSIYLCGESFGGCLALKLMLAAPNLFKKVVLVNPASSFNRRPWIHWGSLISRLLPEWLYQITSIGFLPFLASLGRMTPENRQILFKSVRSVQIENSVQRLSMMRHFHISSKELQQFYKPVLLIASQGDRLLPSVPEAKRLQRDLPNAEVVILPHSGHACLLETDVNLYQIMLKMKFISHLANNT
ncbi:alpha/beta fold hydrolase [Aerosakkonema funiforme]|uniref:alpha/beta fold hydrolase n=1 Tax=Aerosakkonema funiforme TaxID=1246630 RepID=UPI0035B95ADB